MIREQFEQFLGKARQELENKQQKFIAESDVSGYKEYWIDIPGSRLEFIEGQQAKISYEAICIGSWSQAKGSWMWAWAHDSFPEPVRRQSARLRELYEITGSPVFAEKEVPCNEPGALELTAMSIHHLDAIGMYRIPGEQAYLYVAVMRKIESQ
ncbi:DUF6882 domain-containing protein [Saccharibacillus brassicae]|uniref:Uncharacterized protein n=1 Tax=Saccharibacillus brassicae TaxID=2583377 RepID=A0A4Y6UZE2_SACBS|nr:DUF6882 domain-containing protein [Saccharibacillus brassicae]QDH23103.1 hypothetical protein FFV09_20940 [Saccharibacillus brassicae]